MTDEEVYADLPEDPELAFLKLEKFFRSECDRKLSNAHENENVNHFYVEYIGRVLAAIKTLELSTAFDSEVPLIQDVDYNTYLNFNKDVEHYLTGLKIRLARRSKTYSVKLDGATKTKLRHHIEQMRGIIDKLEVTQRKKETLFDKLNNFSAEVDRDRTRMESYGALVVEAAEVFGEAAEKAEPARKWLDSIGRVLWGAKEKENEAKQLPPPKEPKRIEPPKKKAIGDNDDEIPF